METVPTPWSPFLGPPWTFTATWKFAIFIANDRAEVRHKRQQVHADGSEWLIEDVV